MVAIFFFETTAKSTAFFNMHNIGALKAEKKQHKYVPWKNYLGIDPPVRQGGLRC